MQLPQVLQKKALVSFADIKEGPLIKNGPINFVHNFFPNSH